MKTIQASSFFKKVSATAAVRAGMKRPDLKWEFTGLADSTELASLDQDKLVKVANLFIENYGRKLIAQKSDDWEFCPVASEVTFEKAFEEEFSAVSRSRLITKDSLDKLATFYVSQTAKLGLTNASATAGAAVIRSRFALISGKVDALAVMSARILSLVELCEPSEVEPFAELIEALVKEIDELSNLSVTADAL